MIYSVRRTVSALGTSLSAALGTVGATALAVAALLAAPAAAWGQLSGFPKDVVEAKPTLSEAQLGRMREVMDTAMADLATGEPDKVRSARNTLISPFVTPNLSASVPFRINFGRELASRITAITKDKPEVVLINALRIAGEAAAPDLIPIIEDHFEAKSDPVRFAAVTAAGRCFEHLASPTTQPAVTLDRAMGLLRRLGKLAGDEANAQVADAAVLAFQSAMRITDKPNLSDVRPEAVRTLSAAMSARLKGLTFDEDDPAPLLVVVRGGKVLSEELRKELNKPTLPDNARVAAAGFAGESIAWVGRQIRSHEIEDRATLIELTGAGEQAVFFAAGALKVNFPSTRLAGHLGVGNREGDLRFQQEFKDRLVATLTKAPFGHDAALFKIE